MLKLHSCTDSMYSLEISAGSATPRITVSSRVPIFLDRADWSNSKSPTFANGQATSTTSRMTSPRTVGAANNVNNAPAHSSTMGVSPGYVHTTGEATTIIRRELDLNRSLSDGRRRVLESALSLIGHFKDTSHSTVNANYDADPEDDQMPNEVPSELIVMMLYSRSSLHVPVQDFLTFLSYAKMVKFMEFVLA